MGTALKMERPARRPVGVVELKECRQEQVPTGIDRLVDGIDSAVNLLEEEAGILATDMFQHLGPGAASCVGCARAMQFTGQVLAGIRLAVEGLKRVSGDYDPESVAT